MRLPAHKNLTPESRNKPSGVIFVSHYIFRSGKPSSKLRVPFVPDANVGAEWKEEIEADFKKRHQG